MSASKKNILIIKTGALGDLLVATEAIQAISDCAEFSQVGLLGPRLWLELLEPKLWPKLSAIWVLHQRDEVELYLNTGTDWQRTGTRHSIWQLPSNYGAVANLRYESPRLLWPFVLKRSPLRIGSGPWWQASLYTHRAPWLGLKPLLHERDRNLQVISAYKNFAIQGPNNQRNLPAIRSVQTAVLTNYGLQEKSYFLLNPTASERFKAWPAARFKELLAHFSKLNWRVIGAPNETAWLQEIAAPEMILQPKNLQDLISIVGGAKALIANASSMHFIASSLKTPSLVLMGAAQPEMWAPLGEDCSYLRGEPTPGTTGSAAEIAGFESLTTAKVQVAVAKFLSFSKDSP